MVPFFKILVHYCKTLLVSLTFRAFIKLIGALSRTAKKSTYRADSLRIFFHLSRVSKLTNMIYGSTLKGICLPYESTIKVVDISYQI